MVNLSLVSVTLNVALVIQSQNFTIVPTHSNKDRLISVMRFHHQSSIAMIASRHVYRLITPNLHDSTCQLLTKLRVFRNLVNRIIQNDHSSVIAHYNISFESGQIIRAEDDGVKQSTKDAQRSQDSLPACHPFYQKQNYCQVLTDKFI